MVDGPITAPLDGDHEMQRASIEALIDRAVSAINTGDRATATELADQILAADRGNTDAEDLLAASTSVGEIRRLTMLVADLVDSTALSTRIGPDAYHSVVGGFREQVQRIIADHGGHIGGTAGDGVFAVFGHPTAHVDDARRAVRAGLELCQGVSRISEQARRRHGVEIAVRIGIHRGLVYLDVAHDDVYGLAANLAARVSGLAPPGSVVVSTAVESLIHNDFDLVEQPAATVKGVVDPVAHFQVLGERSTPLTLTRAPLIGRERELLLIETRWQQLQNDSPSTPGILIRGEPGIGKSRLAAEAADRVHSRAGAVLEVAGSLDHTGVGLHPIRKLLERHCGIGREAPPAEQLRRLESEFVARGLDPATMIPALAPVLAIGPEHGYEPMPAEGRNLVGLIVASARTYLMACVRADTGMLIADDLQWFDEATLGLLESILVDGQHRLLIVGTCRDNWPPPQWPLETIDLERLSDAQTEELIDALGLPADQTQRAQVRSRCDGIPFHIEQVAASMRERAPEAPHVPDALYDPLLSRLYAERLGVPVAEAAAVIGREFDGALLRAVLDMDQADLDDAINRLTTSAVVEPIGTDTWRFRHELLREVAFELVPAEARRALHGRVADALIAQSPGEPDWSMVATQYENAGRDADAASAYHQASVAARRRGSMAEARAHLGRALARIDRCPPGIDRDRAEITARLERGYLTATVEGAQSLVAVADFERCLQLANDGAYDDELVAALGAVGAYYFWRADLRHARQLLEVAATKPEGQSFSQALDGSRGVLAWLGGDFETATEYFKKATQALDENYERQLAKLWFVSHDPVALAHEHLAWTDLIHGNLAEADLQLGRAALRAEQLTYPQRPYNLLNAADMEVWLRAESGQFERARTLVDSLLNQAHEYELDDVYWQLRTATERAMVDGLAEVCSDTPDLDILGAQIEALAGAISIWQALGAATYRPFFWCMLARFLITVGQLDAARSRIDTALAFAEDTGVKFYSAELLRMRARTQTDAAAKAADLSAARELARSQQAWLFELRCSLDDFDLRGTPARQCLTQVVEKMPRECPLPEVQRARMILDPPSG
ncbi:ATP-binding protein [Mycobacterium sp. 134]|uniref:ATP-binding protein n=1 Tax=Mycobacterium sp. 134 TaxID=3400425 RepID=UPI003AADAE0C